MPSLIELGAFSLCARGARGPFPAVQSEECAWQVLRLHELPAWGLINSFTVWPVGLRLEVSAPWPREIEWALEMPPSHHQALAVGEAAAKLSASLSHLLLPLTLVLSFNRIADEPSDALAAVELIGALTPLDAVIRGVRLKRWRVTAGVLHALTVALPKTVTLGLRDCIMDNGAWLCLKVQPRLERLLFLDKTRITLGQILSLAKGVRQKMKILVGPSCMTDADQVAMHEASKSLSAQRKSVSLPPVIISMLRPC